jgi:ketosteroid isomerase-like protein
MRTIFITILFLASFTSNAQKQEIQKVIETFFEAFHARDSVKLKTICSDKLILQSISESPNGTKLSNEIAGAFYKSIASIPNEMKFQEKLLSFSIQFDGAMAHAWTPYEFYINGKLSHKGVNAFTLFKENELWKIIYIIDTRRK